MKLLYIGERVDKARCGADAVNLRNYTALNKLFGSGFHHYELTHVSRLATFSNLLKGNAGAIQSRDYRNIVAYIKANRITTVFLWSSKLGKLARSIKHRFPDVKIISFFHNIEKQYYDEELKVNPSLKNRFIASVVKWNEKLAVKYSDRLITLNNRDSLLLKSIYGRYSDFELPITFEDKYDEGKARECQHADDASSRLKLLFVGSNFFANNAGVEWFIRNIMPKLVDVELTIVGKGMDEVFQNSENIHVKGYVDDLSECYYSADAVICPIFHGGGMKTKTAEALMYGCPIVGTKEAFEGYELDHSKIGGLAQTPQEMIEAINRIKNRQRLSSCRKYAREIFLNEYSIESTIKILRANIL